jgi:hypothetical protein
MAALIHTGPRFQVESARPLFQLDFPNTTFSYPLYDVSPDGQRFAVLTRGPHQIHVDYPANQLARPIEKTIRVTHRPEGIALRSVTIRRTGAS